MLLNEQRQLDAAGGMVYVVWAQEEALTTLISHPSPRWGHFAAALRFTAVLFYTYFNHRRVKRGLTVEYQSTAEYPLLAYHGHKLNPPVGKHHGVVTEQSFLSLLGVSVEGSVQISITLVLSISILIHDISMNAPSLSHVVFDSKGGRLWKCFR